MLWEWPEEWKVYNIALLELFPILLAFKIFGEELHNKRVLLHTDNQAVMHTVNSQSSNELPIMVLVRDS